MFGEPVNAGDQETGFFPITRFLDLEHRVAAEPAGEADVVVLVALRRALFQDMG